MSFRKSILILLILLVIITGCSKNVIFDEQDRNLLNYNFKIVDLKNIDKTLSNQKYSYSTNIDKKYVAVIIYQSKDASISQYLVKKDESVDLIVPKGSLFIVSLHANRTIAYTWNIRNNIDNGIIKLENRTWIEIPLPNSEKGKSGANYDRHNFYFEPLKLGDEKLVLRYEHHTEQSDESFEFTFNIEVQ